MSKKGRRREQKRRTMVAAVRDGASMRSAAPAHDVSLSIVQWWLRRTGQLSLDQADRNDPIPKRRRRTQSEVIDPLHAESVVARTLRQGGLQESLGVSMDPSR